jgi:predicted RNA-binding Zn ribbon-like protein
MTDELAGEAADEDFLLALLNTTPMVDGRPTDELADPDAGRAWLAGRGGVGSEAERRQVAEVRDVLQAVVRGQRPARALAPFLTGVSRVPTLDSAGPGGERIAWSLSVAAGRELAVRAVLAWGELGQDSPGRLRPCANQACRLFLVDRTKGNTARWCSMAVCGNRMKARRHYQRARAHPQLERP